MKYLLDTNICIYIIKKAPEQVLKRFVKLKPGSLVISNISVAELYYGVSKSSFPNENTIALEEFLQPLHILDFTKEDAIVYGKIRAKLESIGKIIGAMDLLIASQALNNHLILVTNNEKEFLRVENLKIENWV